MKINIILLISLFYKSSIVPGFGSCIFLIYILLLIGFFLFICFSWYKFRLTRSPRIIRYACRLACLALPLFSISAFLCDILYFLSFISFENFMNDIFPKVSLIVLFITWLFCVDTFWRNFLNYTSLRYVAKMGAIHIPLSFIVFFILKKVFSYSDFLIFFFYNPLFLTFVIVVLFLFYVFLCVCYQNYMYFLLFWFLYITNVVIPFFASFFCCLSGCSLILSWSYFNPSHYILKLVIILLVSIAGLYSFYLIERCKSSVFFCIVFTTWYLFNLSCILWLVTYPECIEWGLRLLMGLVFYWFLYMLFFFPYIYLLQFFSQFSTFVYEKFLNVRDIVVGKGRRFWFFNQAPRFKELPKPIKIKIQPKKRRHKRGSTNKLDY